MREPLSVQMPADSPKGVLFAFSIASGGVSEPNVDPTDRFQLEQLARVADLHVSSTTGLPTSVTGRPLTIEPVTRTRWVSATLGAYRPLFERLATSLGQGGPGAEAPGTEVDPFEDPAGDPTAAWLGNVMQFLTPMMMGLSADAQKSLGAQVPFPPRLGDPKEYAQLAMQIVENHMLNGETIRLDGAIRMAPR